MTSMRGKTSGTPLVAAEYIVTEKLRLAGNIGIDREGGYNFDLFSRKQKEKITSDENQ